MLLIYYTALEPPKMQTIKGLMGALATNEQKFLLTFPLTHLWSQRRWDSRFADCLIESFLMTRDWSISSAFFGLLWTATDFLKTNFALLSWELALAEMWLYVVECSRSWQQCCQQSHWVALVACSIVKIYCNTYSSMNTAEWICSIVWLLGLIKLPKIIISGQFLTSLTDGCCCCYSISYFAQ